MSDMGEYFQSSHSQTVITFIFSQYPGGQPYYSGRGISVYREHITILLFTCKIKLLSHGVHPLFCSAFTSTEILLSRPGNHRRSFIPYNAPVTKTKAHAHTHAVLCTHTHSKIVIYFLYTSKSFPGRSLKSYYCISKNKLILKAQQRIPQAITIESCTRNHRNNLPSKRLCCCRAGNISQRNPYEQNLCLMWHFESFFSFKQGHAAMPAPSKENIRPELIWSTSWINTRGGGIITGLVLIQKQQGSVSRSPR